MKNIAIELANLISDWKHADILVKSLQKDKQEARQAILDIMAKTGQKSYDCDIGSVKVSHPRTFDQPMMLNEEPKETTDRFWETITTTTEVFDKKAFKKSHPEIWNKYQIDMTPRLTIK